jgi:hypothetical protein
MLRLGTLHQPIGDTLTYVADLAYRFMSASLRSDRLVALPRTDASGHHRKSSTVGYRQLGQFGQQRLRLL